MTSFYYSSSLYPKKSYFSRAKFEWNMTSEGKQSFISPYNNSHKLFIMPKLHTQQQYMFLNHSFIHEDLIPSVFSIDLLYKWLLMLYRVLLLLLTVEISERAKSDWNMTSEGKQSFISPYNNGHKLFIIPKLHTQQQNMFFN
jgi:hypothetical protein